LHQKPIPGIEYQYEGRPVGQAFAAHFVAGSGAHHDVVIVDDDDPLLAGAFDFIFAAAHADSSRVSPSPGALVVRMIPSSSTKPPETTSRERSRLPSRSK